MSVSEQEIEKEIQDSGKTGRRLTPEHIDSRIASVDCFRYINVRSGVPSGVTICVMVMKNGFLFIGKSGAVDPKNYVKEIGDKLAIEDARRQIWSHEGYVLANELSQK